MISTEVPIMFSKILEIFITELTMRSWLHTEESKRRTVQVIAICVYWKSLQIKIKFRKIHLSDSFNSTYFFQRIFIFWYLIFCSPP